MSAAPSEPYVSCRLECTTKDWDSGSCIERLALGDFRWETFEALWRALSTGERCWALEEHQESTGTVKLRAALWLLQQLPLHSCPAQEDGPAVDSDACSRPMPCLGDGHLASVWHAQLHAFMPHLDLQLPHLRCCGHTHSGGIYLA